MPILKFSHMNGEVVLNKLRMEDITHDKRTALINKESFLQERFKIDEGIYLALNDLFFKMSNLFNKSRVPISAMLIQENNYRIIIVPSRSYVFWNGRSVEPAEYQLLQSEHDIQRQLVKCKN